MPDKFMIPAVTPGPYVLGPDSQRQPGVPRGTVTKMSAGEGYGFVTGGEGREVYFDRAAVTGGRFDRLSEGDDVRFVEAEGEGAKGPQASTVVPVRGRSRRR